MLLAVLALAFVRFRMGDFLGPKTYSTNGTLCRVLLPPSASPAYRVRIFLVSARQLSPTRYI